MSKEKTLPKRELTIIANAPHAIGESRMRPSLSGKGQSATGMIDLTLVGENPVELYIYIDTRCVKIERRYLLNCDADGKLTIDQ